MTYSKSPQTFLVYVINVSTIRRYKDWSVHDWNMLNNNDGDDNPMWPCSLLHSEGIAPEVEVKDHQNLSHIRCHVRFTITQKIINKTLQLFQFAEIFKRHLIYCKTKFRYEYLSHIILPNSLLNFWWLTF